MSAPKAARAPAFQFYPADFLASGVDHPGHAGVGHRASAEVVGAYMLLLCLDWQETGFIFDETELAIVCRMTVPSFRKVWGKLAAQFPERDGRHYNAHLEQQRVKQAAWRSKSSDGGKRGAASRWGTRPDDDHPHSGGYPNDDHPHAGGDEKASPPDNSRVSRSRVSVVSPEREKAEFVSDTSAAPLVAGATENGEPPAVATFVARFYGSATRTRQKDVRQQLRALLTPGGVMHLGNTVRAVDGAHLADCLAAVANKPPRDSNAAITWAFAKLRETYTEQHSARFKDAERAAPVPEIAALAASLGS